MGCLSQNHSHQWAAAEWLPAVHFHEKHHASMMADHPGQIIGALKTFDAQQDAVVRTLLIIRQWPQKLLARPADFNLQKFTELHSDATSCTLGLIGRFWQMDMGLEPIADEQAYRAFTRNDCARLILHNQVIDNGDGNYQVITETFIYCPTAAVRRRMLLYWLAIRPASGWIRKRMLQTIARNIAVS